MIKPILPESLNGHLRTRFYGVWLIFICCTSYILSCQDQPQGPEVVNRGNQLQFACLRFDSASVQNHLDSIHIKGFVMQFYLPESGDNTSPYQLISYAFDSLGDYRNSWIPDTLRIVTDSLFKTFEGRVVLGNNIITREQINDVLIDENGKNISYDYLLLAPTIEKSFNHLTYYLKPVKGNSTINGGNGKMQISSPLPPSRVW